MPKLTWLRIAYWAGAVADAVVAVQMLFPALMLQSFGIDLETTRELRFALRFGAPLMIGWTVLLIWAVRKPIERSGVLLITLLVVFGYVALVVYAVAAGLAELERMIPALGTQAVLIALFTSASIKAHRVRRRA